MIVSVLNELRAEIERVYIVGLYEVGDNPVIMKYIPLIEEYAEEDPAYAALAYALKVIIECNPSDNVEAFTEIYASLNYLLRLHGESIAPGKSRSEHIPVFQIDDIVTTHSFLDLKDLIIALTEPVKGRLAIIRKARENKLFSDFRTYPYLNIALSSGFISPEVEDIIRNEVGEKMIPFLQKGLCRDDGPGNSRRLSLLRDFQNKNINQLQG